MVFSVLMIHHPSRHFISHDNGDATWLSCIKPKAARLQKTCEWSPWLVARCDDGGPAAGQGWWKRGRVRMGFQIDGSFVIPDFHLTKHHMVRKRVWSQPPIHFNELSRCHQLTHQLWTTWGPPSFTRKKQVFFARKKHWISRPHSTVLTTHRWWTARRLGRRCTDVAKTGSVIICFGAQLPEFLGCIHCASASTSSYNAILPSWLTGRF